MRSFAEIPAEIARRVGAGERVALLLLDALGRRALLREADHPLLRRLQITELSSQFPSTTTAHVTTLALGTPVQQHGLYEWRILEPSLDEVICPLRFSGGFSAADGDLVDRLDPAAMLGEGPTLYETLPVASLALLPRALCATPYTSAATRGATVAGFDSLPEGLTRLTEAIAAADGPAYAYLYWPRVDALGHRHGPSSPEYRAGVREALDAVAAAADRLCATGATVLLCADHGQVDVTPDRVDYLEERWPPLTKMLRLPRPAGSGRDLFLHVWPEHVQTVIEELAARLPDGARVCRATDLFDVVGPRLAARLGDVAVLSAPGRQAWLRSSPDAETWVRGAHGGLTTNETETYLARVVA